MMLSSAHSASNHTVPATRNMSVVTLATAETMDTSLSSSFGTEDTTSIENDDVTLDLIINIHPEEFPNAETNNYLDQHILPRLLPLTTSSSDNTKILPLQSESSRWLKYLLLSALMAAIGYVSSIELTARFLHRTGVAVYVISSYKNNLLSGDAFILVFTVVSLLSSIVWALGIDLFTLMMLWHGKQRRELPTGKRLVHMVIVTQYKEPLEVLDATVQSLAEGTLATTTIVILACEERDPNSQEVFEILYKRYAEYFQDFIKTSHTLVHGEIAGCSSNENYAARQAYRYAIKNSIDPWKVMLTICDADSLFDKVYLEHVEAEFWRTPGGENAIYDAPINTYRNLRECNLLVQACEIARCQDGLFNGLEFRPAQSNYSLTLGFAKEIDFWDPSNTSEDLHCTLKAMAHSGQGENVVVRIWSLILNDSVTGLKDRWTQAKRHMWGIEDCAWTLQSFRHVRFIRWLGLVKLTFFRMIFCINCIPPSLALLSPSLHKILYQLDAESLQLIGALIVFGVSFRWSRTVLREYLMRKYILADRKHIQPAGWKNWVMMITCYPLMEQLAMSIFFRFATWAMLVRALTKFSIVYVVAPKSLTQSGGAGSTNGTNKKVVKK